MLLNITKIHRLILRIPLLIRFYGNFACTQVLHLNLYKPMVYNTSTILVVNLGINMAVDNLINP